MHRTGHAAAIYDDYLYIYGGESIKGNLDDMFKLSLRSLEWSEIPK